MESEVDRFFMMPYGYVATVNNDKNSVIVVKSKDFREWRLTGGNLEIIKGIKNLASKKFAWEFGEKFTKKESWGDFFSSPEVEFRR